MDEAPIRSPRRTDTTWSSAADAVPGINLIRLSLETMDALADGHLRHARAASGLDFTAYAVGPACQPVWARRRRQITADPTETDWVTRAAVTDSGAVVGRAGFHGGPDAEGMVEVGYAIEPEHRRHGYARSALRALLAVARAEPDVRVLRATVSPENHASRALVAQHGLVVTGEQWDDEDGLETIFEISVGR